MGGKILVTGADGFIGSHLTEQLVLRGFDVRAFVYYNSQNSWGWLDDIDQKLKDEIDVVAGDVRDYEFVKSSIVGCDYILNLASLIGIPYSYKSPSSYIDTNIKGLMNIMNAAKEKDISKIIHTSTSEVYGSAKFVPMTEKHQLSAQSPYAASKIGADQLALSYNKSFGLPISILRPFNTFGPRQSLRAVIPTIITQCLNKKIKKIKVGNLHVTRDFNYIDDTVDAFISSLKAKNIDGEVINIGAGREISIKNLLRNISEVTDCKKNIYKENKRVRNKATEVDRLCASNVKAKKLLNWKPKFNTKIGFEKGLKITIDWFKKEENLKKFKTNLYNI